MATEERIQYLLNRYAEGSASAKELAELDLLLHDESCEESAENHLVNLLCATEPTAEHCQERLQAVLQEVRKGREVSIRRYWWAAAAVFIGVAVTIWVVNYKATPASLVADRQSMQHDRAPGGNVAVLTLADGKSIILDSAHNGVLAEQGSASVTKSGEGTLTYQAAKGTSTDGAAPVQYNKLSTPRGGQYRLFLPDGSQVWLNAASSITYPTAFTGSVRSVTITGEAYFEIAPNASMPFTVRVDAVQGEKEIRVLGTHFNVKAYNDEDAVRTTLLEGSVQLMNAGPGTILKPGEQGEWKPDGSMHVNPHANVEEAVAWKNGMFQFEQAGLQEIMRQIARWYDVDVVFRGKVPAARFDGEIPRNSNLTEVFKILQLSNVHFTVEDKKVIVEQ